MLGSHRARAYKARFVGYDLSRTLEPCFKVIEILPTGIYGKIRTSKDVIFDKDNNYNYTDEYPSDLDFSNLHQNIDNDISAVLPANKVVKIDSSYSNTPCTCNTLHYSESNS